MSETILSARRIDMQDLGFTVMAKAYEYRVEFVVYDVAGWAEGGFPLWHKAGSSSYPDPVDSTAEADVYLHGEVKWDGCSNWHFDEQDRIMLHGCCRADVQRLGDVMGRCWDIAATMCPRWST